MWRLPKDKPPEEGLGLRLFLSLLLQLLDFVVIAVVRFCCYDFSCCRCSCSCHILLLSLFVTNLLRIALDPGCPCFCYCYVRFFLLLLFLLLLLLQLSYVVVITVCDKPPEGSGCPCFLLWFWLSTFVVVDANLGLRLFVFKHSCEASCLNCCRSPEPRGLETAMADPNWKATSL